MAPRRNARGPSAPSFVGYIVLEGAAMVVMKTRSGRHQKIMTFFDCNLNDIKKDIVQRALTQDQKHLMKRNSEESPLLRLPAEIRNKIWAYALGHHYVPTPPFHDRIEAFAEWFETDDNFISALQVFELCKVSQQVYYETSLMAYRVNTFIFGEQTDFQWFRWKDSFSPSQLRSITSVAPCLKQLYGYFENPKYFFPLLRNALPNLKRIEIASVGEEVIRHYNWLKSDPNGRLSREKFQARMAKRIQQIEGMDIEVVFDPRELEEELVSSDEVSGGEEEGSDYDMNSDSNTEVDYEDTGSDDEGDKIRAKEEAIAKERSRQLRDGETVRFLDAHFNSEDELGDDSDDDGPDAQDDDEEESDDDHDMEEQTDEDEEMLDLGYE